MGIENNECIIATTQNSDAVDSIKQWIETLDKDWQKLFIVLPSMVNLNQTIVFAPDGSKKGWGTANIGKKVRDIFIEKIEAFDNADGSNPFDYVEVGFGEYGQKVLRGNCSNKYTNEDYCSGGK